jgi:hypothetical protein
MQVNSLKDKPSARVLTYTSKNPAPYARCDNEMPTIAGWFSPEQHTLVPSRLSPASGGFAVFDVKSNTRNTPNQPIQSKNT